MSDVLASPHPEIIAAVEYLCGHSSTSSFRDALVAALSARFTNRWHPSDPERGSAYRCLTRASAAPSSLDPLLRRAIVSSNGSIADVAAAMARSMNSDRWTLWIDPGCVSIRMHDNGGGQTFGGSHSDPGTGPAKMGALVGIKEIWGTLPAALIAKSHQSASPPMPMTATRRPSTPQSTIKKMRTNSASANTVATESQDLALNASPSKRSRAIAIVRPESKMATAVIPTPARMPPLSFTLEESTSPYVPSFATGTSAKTASVGGSSSSRCVTPTPPLPLPVSSPLSCDGAANSDDPFARPSSRSSTTSNGSNASCSIFSHSSSESRSSSIGSYSTLASSTVPFSSAASAKDFVPRATPLEMNMAASFQFPANASGLSVLGANTAKSAPNSPSKARRAPRHQHQGHGHTLSTSSAVSVASSAGSSTAAGSQHTRGRASQSSQSSIRVNNSSSTVQDYSNGKVGVLGGGVLLGLAGGSGAAKKDAGAAGQARKHRATSSASSNVSSNGGEADMTVTMSRPRSRSRTPSAHGHANAGQVPMWYNQHQYQPMPVLSHQSHSWN